MNTATENKIRYEIGVCLVRIGVYPNIVGYQNFIDTVICVLKTGNLRINLVEAYKSVGAQNGASVASVERSIRTLLEKCYNTDTIKYLDSFFGYPICNDYRMNAGEFVGLFVSKYYFELEDYSSKNA